LDTYGVSERYPLSYVSFQWQKLKEKTTLSFRRQIENKAHISFPSLSDPNEATDWLQYRQHRWLFGIQRVGHHDKRVTHRM
jgi:hypothetical protein